LLPAQYVRPYVRRNKTDRTDAEALLEATRCDGLQPVPIKTVEQQTLQALHRVRTQWQAARTARINVVRGLLREQGLPVPIGARTVLTRVATILEDAEIALPDLCVRPYRSLSRRFAPWRPASRRSIGSSRGWQSSIRLRYDCNRFPG
jgi:transposase